MSEIFDVPKSEVFGDRNGSVKVEKSWSEKVPASPDAVPQKPFNREEAIFEAVKRRQAGTHITTEEQRDPLPPASALNQSKIKTFVELHHFFVLKGCKMEFIGSAELDMMKFQKDMSGRFFREWVKKEFPHRRDYDEIVSFEDNTKIGEIADLMRMSITKSLKYEIE